MSSIYINNHLKDWIQKEFPDSFKEKLSNWWGRSGNWWSRCIVLKSALSPEQDPLTQICYTLRYDHPKDNSYPAYIELRIQKPTSSEGEDFSELAGFLKERFPNDSDFFWRESRSCYACCRNKNLIHGWSEAKDVFVQIQDRFNDAIIEFFRTEQANGVLEKVTVPIEENNQEVELYTFTLLQLLNLNLKIPDYQRIYCWEEKTIRTLWNDVTDPDRVGNYRLGTIILQRVGDSFQIIDGQQRLVTLSLMLSCLHIEGISLLNESYQSKMAEEYIAYNKFLIRNILAGVRRSERRAIAERLWNEVEFNVLILNDSSIDLAYTFFSNENSRGKALSDFDLLKAHHLRFITENQKQAEHLAKKWDKMILAGDEADNESERAYVRSLSMYVFRLRHWIRMQEWDEKAKYNVKREYEAAPSIPEIPPFGEQFYWNESIQGGSHFFAYVDTLLNRFNSFSMTNAYKSIHRLDMETHKWYRDVIESLLFSYYLKFGEQYLAEAMMLISTRISMHRYENARVNLGKLQKYGAETNVVMMIDRATSPTFFLAELSQAINEKPRLTPRSNIQYRYSQELSRCMELCRQEVEIPSIMKTIER